jgi:hypothetical protein
MTEDMHKADYLGDMKFKPILSSTDGWLQATPLKLYIFNYISCICLSLTFFAESRQEALLLLERYMKDKPSPFNDRFLNAFKEHPETIDEYEIKKGIVE